MYRLKSRPTWLQILGTSIISSRLNTLFPNEVENKESSLLMKTIYVPKKLAHLIDRLPRAMYEDNERAEDETVHSRVMENWDETDKLPKLNLSNNKLGQINPSSIRGKDTIVNHSSTSDYSYDHRVVIGHQKLRNRSIDQIDLNSKKHSVNLSESKSINNLSMDYNNIYSSIAADSSDKKIHRKISLQSKPIISKNIGDMMLKHTRTPIVDLRNAMKNNKEGSRENNYNDMADDAGQSRDSSLSTPSIKEHV